VPKGNVKGELLYTHFSVVMHAERRMAIFAAVNIDGGKLDDPSVSGSWRTDRRVNRACQSDNELYRDNVLDKGHLVRRLDPAWGTQQEIDDAVIDTYHYTNAAPQEHSFNEMRAPKRSRRPPSPGHSSNHSGDFLCCGLEKELDKVDCWTKAGK
jgi:DNA/RNA endonuclease G (NUC1)